jgi:hypothetical protein
MCTPRLEVTCTLVLVTGQQVYSNDDVSRPTYNLLQLLVPCARLLRPAAAGLVL